MTFHAAKKEILQDIYRAKNIIQQIQQKYNQKNPSLDVSVENCIFIEPPYIIIKRSARSKMRIWKKIKKKKIFSENIEIIDSSNNHLLQTTLQENNELRQMLIDQQKQISELIPKVGSNNNNSINMNIFLNEQCKDALNMTDFINSIQLKLEDMELFGTDGYVNGMSNIFLKYLSGMDVTKRPVHCSDLIKETLYIKDENKWDKEKDKLSEAFRKVTKKGLTVIADNEDPEQNHVIMQELFHTEDNKVIKEIAKETYIPGNASSNE